MTASVVVDTNVPRVANAVTDDDAVWDVTCIAACVAEIQQILAGGGLVLDDELRILDEYFHGLSRSGMPGLGDAFAKWAWDHQHDTRYCERVAITADEESFVEFPTHEGLAKFDLSDRKFVAVAVVHGSATILQAVDSKWWGWQTALAESGVPVRFVCPDAIASLHAGKQPG